MKVEVNVMPSAIAVAAIRMRRIKPAYEGRAKNVTGVILGM
jgi:hypothetical protein